LKPYEPRDEVFDFITRNKYKDVLRTHLLIEAQAENIRQKLSLSQFFNIFEAFKTCDVNEDGIITKNEI